MSDYICTQCGNEVCDDDDPRHTCPNKAPDKVLGKNQHPLPVPPVLTGNYMPGIEITGEWVDEIGDFGSE